MEPGERIKQLRERKGLTQQEFGKSLGYSDGFISLIETGLREPSRKFLKKLNDVYGVSSDYILYSGTAAQWNKIEEKLKDAGLESNVIHELHPDYLKSLMIAGREDWDRGYQEGMRVCEPLAGYQALPDSTKKILDNVREIMESGNDTMIDALRANVKAFVEAVRMGKKQNEDKGCD